ncbi:MAG TPA: hypothetical protein VHU15_15715 [Stellaceae bacterium]|jgi:hypothetical protein|nr:hypothetical protein [Stellaceae bacterium]
MANWFSAAQWWVPTVAVAVMTLVALAAARRRLAPVVAIIGAVAVIATVWQQTTSGAVLGSETQRLQEMVARLDDIGRLMPGGPGETPADTVHTVAAGIAALNARIKELETQVAAIQERYRVRTIDDATAAKLEDYLRGFGSRRVVVSCVPDNVEAYDYANRLAMVLKEAGWDAHGPELTKMFGTTPAIPISLYVHGETATETSRILTDAFTRFNIPYKSSIFPNEAIPDAATVELFVASKT